MKVKDWLYNLAENHYVDIIENEVVILPIVEDEDV